MPPMIKQNDGIEMPAIGLGTLNCYGDECENSVKWAIEEGYRYIDTALIFENEAQVGKAVLDKISEGVVTREQMYIVSKLWCNHHDPRKVRHACKLSLKNLGLDYLDAYVMHWPFGFQYAGDDHFFPKDDKGNIQLSDFHFSETWAAMEGLVDEGLTRSIGVANFNSLQLTELLSCCRIKPVHNQVECHPSMNQKQMIEYCKNNEIIVVAYSPLAQHDPLAKTPPFLYDEGVFDISCRYFKTPAQIVLRYLYELGAVPIPKSVKRPRILENIEIFDIKLDEEDRKSMDVWNKGAGERLVRMEEVKGSPYYPFLVQV